jgi:hypothetical protein
MIQIVALCAIALALAVAATASTQARAATPIQGCQTIDQAGAYELTNNITGTSTACVN